MEGAVGGGEKALNRTARNLILLIGQVWRGHWCCALAPGPDIQPDGVLAGSRHTATTIVIHSSKRVQCTQRDFLGITRVVVPGQ